MAVPSNNALFKGMGGNFRHSQGLELPGRCWTKVITNLCRTVAFQVQDLTPLPETIEPQQESSYKTFSTSQTSHFHRAFIPHILPEIPHLTNLQICIDKRG